MNAKLRKLTSRLSIMLTVGVCACGSLFAALPTGAVRMGGIKSSGCYVNTRYAANSRTRVVMSFQLNALPQDTGSYAGIQEKNNRQFMLGVGKDLHFKISVTPAGGGNVIDIGQADTGLHEFDVASGSQKFDGKEYGTSTTDDGATDPLYIFGMNNLWNGRADYFQSITVYSCKIYDGDTLVRDFIPCQYEGRARLWDDANGEWYDKIGDGTFEAIAGITVDEIPSILSDGRQYLKTGVVPTPKTRLELDFQMMSTQGTQMIGFQGNPNEKGQFFFSVNKSGYFASSVVADQGTAEVVTIAAADTKRHTLVMKSGSQTLDGKEYAQQIIPEGVFTDEIWLFAANNQWDSQNKYYCSMRFFGCKIYEGNELIRDYRPVMTALGPAVVDFVSMRQGEPTTCTYDPDESLLTRAAAVVTYGKSYIDTGVRLTPQTAVRVDFKMDKPDAKQSVIGYQGGGNGRPQMIFSIQDRTSKGQGFCFISSLITQADGRDYSVAGPADTNRHVLEIRPGSQKLDGKDEYATEALPADIPAVTDGNLYLFAFNNRYGVADAANRATMRIYRCQIWEGDTLVRDFRPMALPNGVGCLVDAVTGYATYFGKGDFNLGSEPWKQGLSITIY